MAPPTQLLRISELEAQSQSHEVKLARLDESVERLQQDVLAMKTEIQTTNKDVLSIRLTLAQWSVGVALIIAAGTAIGGWFIKSSLDALKTSLVSPHKP